MNTHDTLSTRDAAGMCPVRAILLFATMGTIAAFAPASHAAIPARIPIPAGIPAGERAALLNFYNATSGDSWSDNTGWLGADGTECSWFGVTCDQSQSHVIKLELPSNHLAGQLPGLSTLTELQDLSLNDNLLAGPIPDLSALQQLRNLYLNNNALSGSFPLLAPSVPLEQIDISYNALDGTIPPLNGMPTLISVSLNGNLFTGTLPDLSGLSNLFVFSASFNQLTGLIPAFAGLDALVEYDVTGNDLIGSIPPLAALPALEVIDLSNNQLTGSLPSSYPPSLQFFEASNNALSGSMAPLGSAPIVMYRVGGNLALSGPVGAGPVPNTLHNGFSRLCPSGLLPSDDNQVNDQWSAATNHAPWYSSCAQQPTNLWQPFAWVTFDAPNIVLNASSVMTITLRNINSQALTGISFADTYPAGIANASAPPEPLLANTCGPAGSAVAIGNGNSVALTGGTLQPHASCVIQVKVIGSATGVWPNYTGNIQYNPGATSPGSGPGVLIVNAADQPPAPQNDQIMVPSFGSTNAIVGDLRIPSSVLDNDTDPDPGDYAATATLMAGPDPSCGTLTFNGDGTFLYQSTSGQCQNDSFSYKACDTYQQCAPATAHITITSSPLLQAPTVQKAFAPASVLIGEVSQMSITLTNPDPNVPITGVQFTDNYPEHMANPPVGIFTDNSCGGSLLASPYGASVALSGGTIPAHDSCVITVQVVGTSAGIAENHTGPVTSSNASTATEGVGELTVSDGLPVAAPSVSKAFAPENITVGDSTVMTITILNNDVSRVLTGVTFTDDYPAPLRMANAQNGTVLANTCAGTLTAEPGGTSVALVDGTVAANGWCVVKIQVVGTSEGTTVNHTGPVTSEDAYPGADASATLTVDSAGGAMPQTITFTSSAPNTATVGGPTYHATAMASSGLPVMLTIDGSSAAVCAISNGIVSFIGAGICTIDANQGGDATYAPAPQVGQSFAVGQADGFVPQTIVFTSSPPSDATVGGPAYTATATASSGLAVVLTVDGSSAMVCTISNGVVSFIGAGTCTIDANQGGDATYAPAPQIQQTFGVASGGGIAPQTITFTSMAPVGATVGGPTYLATAIATSGLPVVLTINGSAALVCTISNGTVSFIGAGICTINADQGGDATYAPAPQAQQSFPVAAAGGAAPQTIAFTSTAPLDATVGGAAYLATAAATSGLPVVLTIDISSATVCTVNNGTVSFIGAGACTIDANQGGDAVYAPAPQGQQSFTVAFAGGATAQTITFTSTAPADATVGGPAYLATATATSGLPVVLTIDGLSAAVCTINMGIVSFIGSGICTIDANQGGDATYAPASETQQAVVVASAGGATPQTISFTSIAPNNAQVAGATYHAMAAASSGLPVVLTADGSSITVCALDNDVVTFIGAGTCTIDANQGGDAVYAPAPEMQQSFSVAPAGGAVPQTITFTSAAPVDATVNGPTYLAIATSTSGLPVVLTIDAAAAATCTINAGTVRFIGAGTCTIDANQGGDATYAPAPQLQQSFAVTSDGAAPTVSCVLPRQVEVVGDAINLDLSILFTPPPNASLAYSGTNLPPSLSILGSLLTGTLQASDVSGSPYVSTLTATTVPGGTSASEDVIFEVLPAGEIVFRDGFDAGTSAQLCQ